MFITTNSDRDTLYDSNSIDYAGIAALEGGVLSPAVTGQPAPSPTESPTKTPTKEGKKLGFEALFAVGGLLVVWYLMKRRG